ncbi:MAG TPA: cupredoxin domain-containing protein, partial [Candidatus Saccharimonadales bacterium]|nr:cupredoxin domain-containing protein [Candidatus Saccharimonadales bacterium]
DPTTDTTTSQANTTGPGADESGAEEQGAATITYTDDGFSPAKITVKTGTTVTIRNESSNALQFDSDPHPAHTDNEELNINNVPTGGSETFTVKRTGTFGYHNHLNASDTGTIVVE